MVLPKSPESYRLLVEHLSGNSLVIAACDTVYGILGRAPDTERQLYALKGRRPDTPFLRLASDMEQVRESGVTLPDSPILSLWPGPFTFIFPTPGGQTLALRIPDDTRLQALVKDSGSLLYSTSVNRHGQPLLTRVPDMEAEFGRDISVIEDSGSLPHAEPSTIVNLCTSPFSIVRQGAGTVPIDFLNP